MRQADKSQPASQLGKARVKERESRQAQQIELVNMLEQRNQVLQHRARNMKRRVVD